MGELVENIKKIYCGPIGYDFVNVPDENIQKWILERIESDSFLSKTKEKKRAIFFKLLESSIFWKFFNQTFEVKQNYGVEGIETFISGLACNLEYATDLGVKSFDIGMSHRGRLNTLICVAKKSPSEVFLDYDQTNPEIIEKNHNVIDFMGDAAVH